MDRETISALTHGRLPFANPLSEADVEEAIGLLAIPAGGTALDVGCGNGEVLARVKRRHDVTTMGIEPSPRWAAAARERVDIVHAAPLAEVAPMEAAWDLVVCIASSHAFGTWSDALFGLRRLARPGGRALVGEGFWRRPPSPGFLEALGGASADELPDHDGLLAGARAAGWQVEDERVASDADWALYEETLIANGERALAAHEDADLRAWVAAARALGAPRRARHARLLAAHPPRGAVRAAP
ncbi:MAG TPA: methyltransferase, partial [Solirubrobacteraceae bacterium]|nr:methyltransferase [Solirubrobacteraceae bacterium]